MSGETLVHIKDVEELSPRIWRILAQNPGKFTLQGTNTYIVGTGKSRLLIDTGEGRPEYVTLLTTFLQEQKVSIEKILITHWHKDHTGGVSQILDLFPETKIFKFPDEHDGEWPWKSEPIQDGDVFSVEGATLKSLHTPGHARDHISFLLEDENVLFCGDNVLGQGSTAFEDLGVYMRSLNKLGDLQCPIFYPAHGPIIPDPQHKVQEYVDHRMAREAQILALFFESESQTPKTIVDRLYTGYPEQVLQAAERGVVQHLNKLRDEGKIFQEGDAWIVKVSSDGPSIVA